MIISCHSKTWNCHLLNFVLLSSIVLKHLLSIRCFLPMSLRCIRFYLLWWWDITNWMMIIGRLSYRLGFIARSKFGGVCFVGTHDTFGLRTGNRFLLLIDEVTYTFYICSVVWPFLWTSNKEYMAKFREVFTVPLSHSIRAQFQHHCRIAPAPAQNKSWCNEPRILLFFLGQFSNARTHVLQIFKARKEGGTKKEIKQDNAKETQDPILRLVVVLGVPR